MSSPSIMSIVIFAFAGLALTLLANVTYQVWRLLRLKVKQNEIRLENMKKEQSK